MKRFVIGLCLVLFTAALLMGAADPAEPKSSKPKPALLVIDVQNVYLNTTMSPEDTTLALPRIEWAIQLFRKAKLPIIRVYHNTVDEYPNPGDEDFEFPSRLSVTEDDPKVIKNYPSAFFKTNLAELLREKGCDTVFLCGLSATGCVLGTLFGSYENHFNSFMIEDALISPNAEHTNNIEDMFKTINLSSLKFVIESISE